MQFLVCKEQSKAYMSTSRKYGFQSVITEQDIEILVRPKIDSNIFNLVDAVSAGNQEKAINELYKLYKNSVYELVILSMILRQFKNLIIIKELLDFGNNQAKIQKETKLHPFVVKKTINQSKKFSFKHLKSIYKIILDYDVKLKTGELNNKLGLEMLIAEVCL